MTQTCLSGYCLCFQPGSGKMLGFLDGSSEAMRSLKWTLAK